VFFRLKQGDLSPMADGKDKRLQFKLQPIKRELPKVPRVPNADLAANFERNL